MWYIYIYIILVLNLVESDEKKSVIGIPTEQNIEFSHAAVKTDVSIENWFSFSRYLCAAESQSDYFIRYFIL